MKMDVLLGMQWGDEGKGKIVDVLTPEYDLIARFQGGPNAGHTLEFDGIKHVLHTIPSGIFREGTHNLIGNGVVIDPVILKKEVEALEALGVDVNSRLSISKKAHLILPTHKLLDQASELAKGKKKIGSTLKGIGPTYMDKTGRNGFRVGDALLSDARLRYESLVNKHRHLLSLYDPIEEDTQLEEEWLEAMHWLTTMDIVDSEPYVNDLLRNGKKVLAEGAQGALLDIDFGTYPFVTSSNTTSAGACTGLGVAPNRIGNVYGIFKAYCTRVGSGPFPTELTDALGEEIQNKGHEFGSTTGRARRCGWLDLPALKYSCMVNGVTHLNMMKADVLSGIDELKICVAYQTPNGRTEHLPFSLEDEIEPIYETLPGWSEDITGVLDKDDFPENLAAYIRFIEKHIGVPINIISVGPDREQTILLDKVLA
ncbi:MAG: adenylosuccinate synthase [Flavobacteriales bacterium]|nr:adenylosuccinate synthase [Flavobacteriales bacterium]